MDLNLTEEQDMVVGIVRRFVREEILPLELHLDPDADELAPDDKTRLIDFSQGGAFEHAFDSGDEAGFVEWFDQEVHCAGAHGFDRHVQRGVRGDDDHGDRVGPRLQHR